MVRYSFVMRYFLILSGIISAGVSILNSASATHVPVFRSQMHRRLTSLGDERGVIQHLVQVIDGLFLMQVGIHGVVR